MAQTKNQADHFAHRFDDPGELAKTFDDPARDEWQMPSRVIDALQIAPGQVVADIGAGTGYFTIRLARAAAAPKVYAVDIEPSVLAMGYEMVIQHRSWRFRRRRDRTQLDVYRPTNTFRPRHPAVRS